MQIQKIFMKESDSIFPEKYAAVFFWNRLVNTKKIHGSVPGNIKVEKVKL